MKCPKCNEELEEGVKICTSCKEALEEQPAETAAPETEAADDGSAAPAEPVEVVPAAEPAVQEPAVLEPEKKKMGTGVKVGIGVAVAAVAIIGGLFVSMNQKDPKTVVVDAFKSVYTSEKESPIEEIFGFEQLSENMMKENYENGIGFKLESSSDEYVQALAGSGISMMARNDIANQKSALDLIVEYNNMNLLSMNVYLDRTKMMLAVPEMSSKTFLLNYGDDLAGQIENSPFIGPVMEQSGMDFTAFTDYMDYIWSFYEEGETPFDIAGLWDRYKEGSQAIENLKAAMDVKKAGKASYTMDGGQVNCQGYDVVITKDALVQFMDTSSKFFLEDETLKKDIIEYMNQIYTLSERLYGISMSEQSPEEMMEEAWSDVETSRTEMIAQLQEVMGDVTMTVYVDKKGRMAAIDAATTMTYEEGDSANISLHGELKGGAYLTQNMDLEITVTPQDGGNNVVKIAKQGLSDDAQLTCDLSVDVSDDTSNAGFVYTGTYGKADGSYHMAVSLRDETEEVFSADMTGVVENLVKGKSFNVVADSIKIAAEGQELVNLSGFYSIEPMEGEVAELEGDILDVLAATEDDWVGVIQEGYEKLFGLISQFQ